jgi:hypothetical protein
MSELTSNIIFWILRLINWGAFIFSAIIFIAALFSETEDGIIILFEGCCASFLIMVVNGFAWFISRDNYWGLGNQASQSEASSASFLFQFGLLIFIYTLWKLYFPIVRDEASLRLEKILRKVG